MNSKSSSLILIVVFLFVSFSNSNGQCSYIQADKFDNVWVVNRNEVICFDKQSKKVGIYSNILLGNPSYLDVLDPFRVIVFYPNSQAISILNNTVAEISKPILLREKGISDASLVCRSSKGGFWVLDRANWEILHFDSGFNQTGEKFLLDMTFSGSKPIFMQEYRSILYLAFKGKSICRFDQFGAQLGDIPINVDNYFAFIDSAIVYQTKGKTFLYNLESNQIRAFDVPFPCTPVKIQGKFLYFDGKGISCSQNKME